MISENGYIGTYKGRDVIAKSYMDYERDFANDKIDGDVIYWINNLGTLVWRENVIGKMDKTGKITNCNQSFSFGNIIHEPNWGNWTVPSVRENLSRTDLDYRYSRTSQEDNSNFEMKKSDEALSESQVKISLESKIDLSGMSEGIDKFLEEAASIDWGEKAGSVGE
jgi:hypothetical protein